MGTKSKDPLVGTSNAALPPQSKSQPIISTNNEQRGFATPTKIKRPLSGHQIKRPLSGHQISTNKVMQLVTRGQRAAFPLAKGGESGAVHFATVPDGYTYTCAHISPSLSLSLLTHTHAHSFLWIILNTASLTRAPGLLMGGIFCS